LNTFVNNILWSTVSNAIQHSLQTRALLFLSVVAQSCPWVESTYGLGWIGLGWIEVFSWVGNISKNSKTAEVMPDNLTND